MTTAEAKKDFLKLFGSLCSSRSSWQVWADLMACFACMISNQMTPDKTHWDEREEEYLKAAGALKDMDAVAKMFSLLVTSLDINPDQDLLGSLYMELNLGNHWKGQFFTPYSVCSMMSSMTLGERIKRKSDKKYVSICDPSCGAGATLVSAANELHRMGINYQTQAVFVGQDIDRIVGMMCYIQLSLLGCPGYVVIADTLTNPLTGFSALRPCPKEGQEFWYTPFFFRPEWQGRILCERMDEALKGRKEEKLIFYFDFEKEGADVRKRIEKTGIAV